MCVNAETLERLLDAHSAALALYVRQWCDTPEDISLRDEIVRDGVNARLADTVVSAESPVVVARPLSSGELLNQILREE
jgi:hypothetical protein